VPPSDSHLSVDVIDGFGPTFGHDPIEALLFHKRQRLSKGMIHNLAAFIPNYSTVVRLVVSDFETTALADGSRTQQSPTIV
jgi:hypothetical protein